MMRMVNQLASLQLPRLDKKRPPFTLMGKRFKQSTVFFKFTEEIEDFICDWNDKAHVNAVRTYMHIGTVTNLS